MLDHKVETLCFFFFFPSALLLLHNWYIYYSTKLMNLTTVQKNCIFKRACGCHIQKDYLCYVMYTEPIFMLCHVVKNLKIIDFSLLTNS
jgi:hypothetical protein